MGRAAVPPPASPVSVCGTIRLDKFICCLGPNRRRAGGAGGLLRTGAAAAPLAAQILVSLRRRLGCSCLWLMDMPGLFAHIPPWPRLAQQDPSRTLEGWVVADLGSRLNSALEVSMEKDLALGKRKKEERVCGGGALGPSPPLLVSPPHLHNRK